MRHMLISHRGNIDGVNKNFENQPNYIDDAIRAGYDVEVDIWYIDDKLYLGHDTADYQVDIENVDSNYGYIVRITQH